MDIFFCDDCGNRVTDADLRSGKGVRRRHVVTCSSCVDGSAAARVAAVDPVRVAIDRAQTTDAPVEPEIFTAPSPSEPEKPELHDTAKVRTLQPSLADALGGFGALAPKSPAVNQDVVEDVDELIDDAPVSAKDETSAVSRPGKQSPAAEKAETEPVAVDDAGARARRQNVSAPPGEKAETDEHDVVESPKPQARSGKSTSNRQAASKGSKSKSSTTRATRPISGKSTRKKALSQQLLLLSVLSAIALVLVIIVAVSNREDPAKKPRQEIHMDFGRDLDAAVANARAVIYPVLSKGNDASLAEIAGAQQAIQQMNSRATELEAAAKKQGLDEDAISRIMSSKGLQDINAQRMTLGQMKAKKMTGGP